MPDITASVLFCDDVRHELGAKASVMGIYRHFMGIEVGAPAVHKLVVLVLLDYARDQQGAQASIVISDEDKAVATIEFALGAAQPQPPEAAALGVPDRVCANVPIELLGYPAPHGAKLAVQVRVGDFVHDSAPLYIVRSAAPGATAADNLLVSAG